MNVKMNVQDLRNNGEAKFDEIVMSEWKKFRYLYSVLQENGIVDANVHRNTKEWLLIKRNLVSYMLKSAI